MFGFLDDIPLLGKKVAATVTRKGATMTATALAAPFVPVPTLPIVAVLTGLPIRAALTGTVHWHRESKVLENFRQEIAATFGIAEEDVTHDHLRALAFGNEYEGIDPQPFFREVLQHNDNNRWIKIGATAIAAVGAICFAFAQGGGAGSEVFNSFKDFFDGSGLSIIADNAKNLATAAWAATVGSVLVATDYLATALGHDIFGSPNKTAYEKVEYLAKKRGHGENITPEQVMEVIVAANPDLQAEIRDNYAGSQFKTLRADTKAQLIEAFDDNGVAQVGKYPIREATEKINMGVMKINELAFIAVDERSGVPERSLEQAQQARNMQENRSRVKEFTRSVAQAPKQWRQEFSDHRTHRTLIDSILQGHGDGIDNIDMPAGAIHFAEREATPRDMSATDRLEMQRVLADKQEVTIH